MKGKRRVAGVGLPRHATGSGYLASLTALRAFTCPLPYQELFRAPPSQAGKVPLSVPTKESYPAGTVVGQGWASAVRARSAFTWPGRILPFSLMIKAAIP